MPGFRTEPVVVLQPPNLPEQVGLHIAEQRQQSVTEQPALVWRVAREPHAQGSIVVAVRPSAASFVTDDEHGGCLGSVVVEHDPDLSHSSIDERQLDEQLIAAKVHGAS